MTQEYIGTKIVTAWPETRDGKAGYAVKYEDGYTSWSPADTFEAAYLPLGVISHRPTFQQRVIGERAQLHDKVVKLECFIDSEPFNALDFDSAIFLREQLQHMRSYLEVLDKRIAKFPS